MNGAILLSFLVFNLTFGRCSKRIRIYYQCILYSLEGHAALHSGCSDDDVIDLLRELGLLETICVSYTDYYVRWSIFYLVN